jgi:hypothetical protein
MVLHNGRAPMIARGTAAESPVPLPMEPRGTRNVEEPWPVALLPLKLLAKAGDRGAGDVIARVIGPIGGDSFKNWYKKIFGKGCGCGARQEALNTRWPLTAS